MKKAFLICPVRGHNPNHANDVVEKLENNGWIVHYPPRDTDQIDDTGYRICLDNLQAISDADKIFIFWDGKSQGSVFDAGMAFALNKPIEIVSVPDLIGEKSFQDMLAYWERKKANKSHE